MHSLLCVFANNKLCYFQSSNSRTEKEKQRSVKAIYSNGQTLFPDAYKEPCFSLTRSQICFPSFKSKRGVPGLQALSIHEKWRQLCIRSIQCFQTEGLPISPCNRMSAMERQAELSGTQQHFFLSRLFLASKRKKFSRRHCCLHHHHQQHQPPAVSQAERERSTHCYARMRWGNVRSYRIAYTIEWRTRPCLPRFAAGYSLEH